MQWLRAGQVDRALTVARTILADPAANPEAYYNGACVFAQAIATDPSQVTPQLPRLAFGRPLHRAANTRAPRNRRTG